MASYFGDYTDFLSILGAVSSCYVILRVGRQLLRVAWRMILRQTSVDLPKLGRWAVVTGCTDGIGKCFALQLAEKGMDIVLISRNPQKLSAVADHITRQYRVGVKVITADFRETDIYDNIKAQLAGLDIGILINNVGTLNRRTPGYFCEADDLDQFNKDIIHVNILSCVMMTGIVLPGMLERKRGTIINVSSSAALRPLPFYSVYSATKVFMRFFSEALHLEYSSQGVTIQVQMPSVVQSQLSQLICKACGVEKGLLFPTAERYVSAALNTVGREPSTVGYWPHELLHWINGLIPDGLFVSMLLQHRNKLADLLKTE